MVRIHQRGGAAVIHVHVLHGALIFHMQTAVSMVMVIGFLAMNHPMAYVPRTLRDARRAPCRCRLHKQSSQENNGI